MLPEYAVPRSLVLEMCAALDVDLADVVELRVTQNAVRVTLSYPILSDVPTPDPWADPADVDDSAAEADRHRTDARWSDSLIRDPLLGAKPEDGPPW